MASMQKSQPLRLEMSLSKCLEAQMGYQTNDGVVWEACYNWVVVLNIFYVHPYLGK